MLGEFKKQLDRAKAELKGEARPMARLLLQAKDVPKLADKLHSGKAESTNTAVRMLDGKPMVYFTDGSLRHALGRKTTKAARKALKKARRAQKPS